MPTYGVWPSIKRACNVPRCVVGLNWRILNILLLWTGAILARTPFTTSPMTNTGDIAGVKKIINVA